MRPRSLLHDSCSAGLLTLCSFHQLLYDFDWEENGVTVVQALLIVSGSITGQDRPQDKSLWTETAITRCIDAQLQARCAESRATSHAGRRETMLLRRIWWVSFIHDRHLSLGARRVPRLLREDHNTPPVSAAAGFPPYLGECCTSSTNIHFMCEFHCSQPWRDEIANFFVAHVVAYQSLDSCFVYDPRSRLQDGGFTRRDNQARDSTGATFDLLGPLLEGRRDSASPSFTQHVSRRIGLVALYVNSVGLSRFLPYVFANLTSAALESRRREMQRLWRQRSSSDAIMASGHEEHFTCTEDVLNNHPSIAMDLKGFILPTDASTEAS